jgi:hypothetical protein
VHGYFVIHAGSDVEVTKLRLDAAGKETETETDVVTLQFDIKLIHLIENQSAAAIAV